MLTIAEQPLAVASRVLQSATIAIFRKPPFTARGWKILDRWALHSPTKLQAIEQADVIELVNRVLDQQQLETTVLTDALPHSEGLAEREVLALHEIRMAL